LRNSWNNTYYEGDVGIPRRYAEIRDKKQSKRKKKVHFKRTNSSYVFNECGTVALDNRDGDVLRVNGRTSFRHKRKANVFL